MILEPPRCPSHELRLVSIRDCQRSPSNVRLFCDDVRPSMSTSCALAFSASPRKLNTRAPLDVPFHAVSFESQLRAHERPRSREWRCAAWRTKISSPPARGRRIPRLKAVYGIDQSAVVVQTKFQAAAPNWPRTVRKLDEVRPRSRKRATTVFALVSKTPGRQPVDGREATFRARNRSDNGPCSNG